VRFSIARNKLRCRETLHILNISTRRPRLPGAADITFKFPIDRENILFLAHYKCLKQISFQLNRCQRSMELGSQLKTSDLCSLPKGRMEIAIGICDSLKYFLLVNNSVQIIERYAMEILAIATR